MSRLTKYIRQQMAIKLVHHRYKAKATELTTRNRLLFERVYKFIYDAKTREAMDALLAINPDALPTTTDLNLNVGMAVRIYNSLTLHVRNVGVLAEGAKAEPVRVLDCHTGWTTRIPIPSGAKADPTLHDDVKNFAIDLEKFRNECDIAYREAITALEVFSTGKKLAKEWPEAMPVIGHLIPEDSRALPVVQMADINRKFELPPEAN